MFTQDVLIEFGIKLFSRILELPEIKYEYAVVDSKTSTEVANSILMAYDHNSSNIIVNPLIRGIYEEFGYDDAITSVLILSNIAHELRHAWQFHQPNFIDSITNGTTFGQAGVDYAGQIHEIDAYAFQEAFLKHYFDNVEFTLDIDKSISDVVITSIHEKSKELYQTYKSKF